MRRLGLLGSTLLAFAVSAAAPAQWKVTFREDHVKLGRPVISEHRALSIARSFLGSIHVDGPSSHTVHLVPRRVGRHAVSSVWFIEFGKRYQVSVSAQTGRVMRYADAPNLERVSRLHMFNKDHPSGSGVLPEFSHLPGPMLVGRSPKLTETSGRPAKITLEGMYIEWPDGMEVIGARDLLELVFSPRTGRLVLFSRSLDLALDCPANRVAVSRALAAAGRANEVRLATRAPRPTLAYSDPQLAYALVPIPEYKKMTYVGGPERAELCWIVKRGSKIVGVSMAGDPVAVWSVASE